MACHQVNMLKQRGMRNKQQIKENKVFFCIFAAETIIIQTNDLQRYEEIPYFIIYGTYITCLIREKVVTFRMVKLNMLLSIFLITK